jgi:hypothetical protein
MRAPAIGQVTDSTAKKLVYGSARISGEFHRETSHACPSK